jgi:hypothetical protein
MLTYRIPAFNVRSPAEGDIRRTGSASSRAEYITPDGQPRTDHVLFRPDISYANDRDRKVLDARFGLCYPLRAFVALVGPFAFEVKGCKVALAAVLFSA